MTRSSCANNRSVSPSTSAPSSPFQKRAAGAPVGVALGTMNFGKRTPEAEARRIVDRAWERGVRVIDTANVYENGESERIVGRAVGARAHEWTIATKVGLDRKGGKPEGLSPAAIRAACDGSKKRLGVDAFDVYYLHAPDRDTPVEATLETMFELIRSGVARAIGVSNFASWQILEMIQFAERNDGPRPVVAQQLYNLVVRQLDVEYFRFASRYGLFTTTYNALAGGLLARDDISLDRIPPGSRFDKNTMYQRRYLSKALFEARSEYMQVAREAGMPLGVLAYAWLASRADVDSVLVGPATTEQLDFALDALARPLDAEHLQRIDRIAQNLAGTDARYAR